MTLRPRPLVGRHPQTLLFCLPLAHRHASILPANVCQKKLFVRLLPRAAKPPNPPPTITIDGTLPRMARGSLPAYTQEEMLPVVFVGTRRIANGSESTPIEDHHGEQHR